MNGVPEQLDRVFCQLGPHDEHPWTELPWKGVHNKVLFLDPITGVTLELARLEEGAEFPEHYHTTVQTLFLISGRIRTGDGEVIEPGTFNVIPAGERHGPYFAEEDSVQLKYFSAIPVYILSSGETYLYRYNGETTTAGRLEFRGLGERANIISD